MSALPEPMTQENCDCTDLDGFMLNVERLMASELVALSSHEVIGAAVLLWCRAWKQTPAASLPDDERIIAAFAKMSLQRFRKLQAEILRGFVKCSDGRLYHRTLAVEARRAFDRKQAFRKKREMDANRLRKWRGAQTETHVETPSETQDETRRETRFVAEGQGQGQGHISSSLRSDDTPPASQGTPQRGAPPIEDDPDKHTKPQPKRLPADWALTPALLAIAAKHGYSEREARFIAERFENHWRSAGGRTAAKLDWARTWAVWVSRENRRQVREGAAAWNDNGGSNGANWSVRIDLWRKRPQDWPDRWGPKPDEPGYKGPALDLFAASEARQ